MGAESPDDELGHLNDELPHLFDQHGLWVRIIDVATKARVKKLVLYHHDPDRTDEALDQIAKDVGGRAADMEIVVAREKMELAV